MSEAVEKCSCGSTRCIELQAKCSDMCSASYYVNDRSVLDKHGYAPRDLGLGGGDYIDVTICANCGKIWPPNGFFPLSDETIREALEGM